VNECEVLRFDGGARGNGALNAKCAIGVYRALRGKTEYDRFDFWRKCRDIHTNNEAEITAAIAASEAALDLATFGCKQVIFEGDSTYVISCIASGRILGYDKYCRWQHADLWCRLKDLIDELHEKGVT